MEEHSSPSSIHSTIKSVQNAWSFSDLTDCAQQPEAHVQRKVRGKPSSFGSKSRKEISSDQKTWKSLFLLLFVYLFFALCLSILSYLTPQANPWWFEISLFRTQRNKNSKCGNFLSSPGCFDSQRNNWITIALFLSPSSHPLAIDMRSFAEVSSKRR